MYKGIVTQITRWRITGRLRTDSPLHIGNGDTAKIGSRGGQRPEAEGVDPEYATIFVDHETKPLIPATSLKGALCAWAKRNLDKPELKLAQSAFGGMSSAGIVVFKDAFLVRDPQRPPDKGGRFYDPERKTCLTPSVVIDPATRTAQEGLLYYTEFVPQGAEFELVIDGQDLAHSTGPASAMNCDTTIALLNAAFHGGLSVGSDQANGWGIVTLRLEKVEVAGPGDVHAWLKAGAEDTWCKALKPRQAGSPPALALKPPRETAVIAMDLQFDGPMLVNDPSRTVKGSDPVAHATIRTAAGDKFILPASSVRGAFRAQARRIWNTILQNQLAATSGKQEVNQSGGQTELDLFLRMFGATGWRSPIHIADFQLVGPAAETLQEFVAIDRFTGGAAAARKFNALALWKPLFRGRLEIDLWRLGEAKVTNWQWLLLAFVLRDWVEGDGYLGFGRSKGYGAFRASVRLQGGGPAGQLLDGILARKDDSLQDSRLDAWAESLSKELAGKEHAA